MTGIIAVEEFVMKLQIPQASQKFPTITYNVAHFVVTAVEK